MASFAQLDDNNVVINVIKIPNDGDILDENGNESEALGIAKCKLLFGGNDSNWKQTFFGDNPRRYRLASIGCLYDPQHDIFTQKILWPSWVLDTSTYKWVPPVPKPAQTDLPEEWFWEESSRSWVKESILEPGPVEGHTWHWNTTTNEWDLREIQE